MAQLIPFAELTCGTKTVHFTAIQGQTYMSISNIIMVVCKQNRKDACDTWQDIPEKLKTEVKAGG